jgi:hypothetical protein
MAELYRCPKTHLAVALAVFAEVFGGLPPLHPSTIPGTTVAGAEAKSKFLSTPQTLRKREIPNNDAANII